MDTLPPSEYCQTMTKHLSDPAALRAAVAEPFTGFASQMHLKATQSKGNAVHSPFSLTAVLSMILAGAEKETAAELAKAMSLPKVPDAAWHKLHGAGNAALTCPGEYDSVRLNVANAIFPQKGKGLVPAYVSLLKEVYDAPPTELDYAKDPEAARKHINDWVKRATADKIPELLAPGMLLKDSKLTLVNAIYLNGSWQQKFPKGNTKDGDFHAPSGTKKAKMMHVAGGQMSFKYAALDGYRAAATELDDGTTEFVVLLPDAGKSLPDLEKTLDGPALQKVFTSLKGQRLDLTLPRFKIETTLKLVETLKALGINRLFTPGASQLGGIDGGKDLLFVSDVIQKAMIDVNEEGLEAAAATAAMMRAGSAAPKPSEPVAFVVDRPFLYVVRDRVTGFVLFMGRIEDPTAS